MTYKEVHILSLVPSIDLTKTLCPKSELSYF